MSGRVGVEQTPDYEPATVALMAAMGCRVESDSPEGPCCEPPAACHGHGLIWYCTEHDWQEDGNSEGVCGYALMLAQALAPVLAAAVREARAAAWDEGFNSDYEGDGWPPNPYRVSNVPTEPTPGSLEYAQMVAEQSGHLDDETEEETR